MDLLNQVDKYIWHVALLIILVSCAYLTVKSKFFQFKVLFSPIKTVKNALKHDKDSEGIHPLKLYCTSIGGMVGIGNIVAVCAGLVIGGPGSLFWLTIASFLGMLIKYSESYLGIIYRIRDKIYQYEGGPMYYLQKAFKSKVPAICFALLLAIYAADPFLFLTVSDTMSESLCIPKTMAIIGLIILIYISVIGGIKRVSNICSLIMPIVVIVYLIMGTYYLIISDFSLLKATKEVLQHAFCLKSMLGSAVAGATRAAYSGDIGTGYEAVVQSQTKARLPETQAKLSILALFTDTIVCLMTLLILYASGLWHNTEIEYSDYIKIALSKSVPLANLIINTIFILGGFTTLIGYLNVGLKASIFINRKIGKQIYLTYAFFSYTSVLYLNQHEALTFMSILGGMMIVLNIIGILKLRKHLSYG